MDEYIKREDAYQTLTEYYHQRTEIQHDSLREALSKVPSTDVAPVRHGHWESLYWAFDYYCCSECGFEQRLEEFLYCPNCGAKMDKEAER